MKILNHVKQAGINFCKCGVTGWCLEVMFTSVESMMLHDWRLMGKTSLLMFPIYGLGALLAPIGKGIDRWLDVAAGVGMQRKRWTASPWPKTVPLTLWDRVLRHGMLYMVLIFVAEYISGAWLREKGICPWDYTGRHSNINGLIRLDFAPLWFGTGLLFEKITTRRQGKGEL
ncbi:MAG: hypothetical protein HFG65_11870 [Hungatella sp.]|nr:hypothetical protein [Hungatella sp.]